MDDKREDHTQRNTRKSSRTPREGLALQRGDTDGFASESCLSFSILFSFFSCISCSHYEPYFILYIYLFGFKRLNLSRRDWPNSMSNLLQFSLINYCNYSILMLVFLLVYLFLFAIERLDRNSRFNQVKLDRGNFIELGITKIAQIP